MPPERSGTGDTDRVEVAGKTLLSPFLSVKNISVVVSVFAAIGAAGFLGGRGAGFSFSVVVAVVVVVVACVISVLVGISIELGSISTFVSGCVEGKNFARNIPPMITKSIDGSNKTEIIRIMSGFL